MLKLIELTLDKFLWIPPFQRWINARCGKRYGMDFIPSESNDTMDQVFTEYNFLDIRKDDIVLDIGANVGTLSIFIAKQGVKKVYAVEPIMIKTLNENIKRNNIKNIEVMDGALGDGTITVSWSNDIRTINAWSLSDIIIRCGGHIDFLKCDCEGGEWCIKTDEIKNIRRIEMEVHNFTGNKNFNDMLRVLYEAGFKCHTEMKTPALMMVHAYNTYEGQYD